MGSNLNTSGERSIYVSDDDVGSDMSQLDDCQWWLWKWDTVMINNVMRLKYLFVNFSICLVYFFKIIQKTSTKSNKANLRDLIAATGLVILLKLDLNRRFFSPCDLDIWWMTQKNNRAPLLCYFKLFASFRSHWWIQTGVAVRKRLIWVKIDAFFSRVTLKFDGWPSKTIGHLFYATSSFVYHFVAIGEYKLELQSGNTQSGSNDTLLEPCDLEIWRMTFNKANLRDLKAATGL